MAGANFGAAIGQITRLFEAGTVAGLSESQLLDRFVTGRDESAFEALVSRHGPLVLGVCRRLLRDPHDVEDAFQATFLVLVRRAGSIRDGERLGPWLHGVAHRVARRIRARSARRLEREKGGEVMAAREPSREASGRDIEFGCDLHEELARLPESYRSVLVLCDLQGLTHDEAARRLGWPIGTVKGRQSRARDLLRRRLGRRSWSPTATAIAAVLAADAHAAVPPMLIQSTVRAAIGLAAGGTTAAAGLASVSAVATAHEVAHAMALFKVKMIAAAVAGFGIIASGAGAIGLGAQFGGVGSSKSQTQKNEAAPSQNKSQDSTPTEDESPATPEIARAREALAKARIELVRRRFEQLITMMESGVIGGGMMGMGGMGGGTGGPESIVESAYQASLDVMGIQREALGNAFEQSAAVLEHRERMERLQKALQTPNFANLPGENPALADYYVAEADLWQAELNAGKELSQPPGSTRITPGGAVEPAGKARGFAPGGDIDPRILDARTVKILEILEKPLAMPFHSDTPLEDVLQYIRQATKEEGGELPIYVDPLSLQDAEVTMQSPVTMELEGVPLKTTLRLLLQQIRLNYIVKEGLVLIGCPDSITFSEEAGAHNPGVLGGVPGYGFVPIGGFPDLPQDPGGFGGGAFQ